MANYKKIVIGIDQSYQNTGISIAADGKLVKVTSCPLSSLQDNSEKRKALSLYLIKVLAKVSQKSPRILVLCERIRTFSGGHLSTNYIKATGALIACIVDVCREYDIPVYSVATTAWKSAVVGTSKPDADGNPKMPTIKYICKLGFKDSIITPASSKQKKDVFEYNGGRYKWNDDAADSAGIALYGFVKNKKILKET